MKLSPAVLVLLSALAGALAWGNCQRGRADVMTLKLEVALQAHHDSIIRWAGRRDTLSQEIRALREDSTLLAQRVATARTQASLTRQRLDSLLARQPDVALGDAVRRTLVADSVELASCQAVGLNCEQRAANAEARASGDSVQLALTVVLLQQTEAAWHTEQRKNAPGFLGLGSYWRARAYTIPLTVLALLSLSHR